MVGPSLGAFLQESVLGIHAVFFAQVACAGLAALVTVSCLSRAEEEATGKKSDKTSGILDAKDAIKENGGRLVRVLGLAFAVQCVRKGRELFFSLSGRESGISDMFIGQITALSFGIDALTSPLAGYLMDSYGRRIAGVASLSLHSLGLSILALHSVAAVVASAVLTGLGNGLGSGLLMTLGSDLAPAGPGRGAFLAVYRLLFNSMDFITPGVLGALTSFSSLQAAELTTGTLGQNIIHVQPIFKFGIPRSACSSSKLRCCWLARHPLGAALCARDASEARGSPSKQGDAGGVRCCTAADLRIVLQNILQKTPPSCPLREEGCSFRIARCLQCSEKATCNENDNYCRSNSFQVLLCHYFKQR